MHTLELMQDIDRRYRSASTLTHRRMFSIFYSRIDPSEGLVLGINPGGDPKTWSETELASITYYENWEHEYVDCRYAIQEPMLPFLENVFSTDSEGVRRIPKTNLAFRRSNGVDKFEAIHGMSMTAAQIEAQPFVAEMIAHVSPTVIILEGMTLLDAFRRRYSDRTTFEAIGEPIYALHRGKPVRVYQAQRLFVSCLQRVIPVVAIGHPSHFGSKPEFTEVELRTKSVVSIARSSSRHHVPSNLKLQVTPVPRRHRRT